MAKLGQRFDATAHDTEQRSEFEDLPAGIMQFEIEASEIVETGPEGARTGVGLKYTANVLAPDEVKGRKFFGFINLENSNAQAQEIGQRELASLCRACSLDGVDDSEELHFLAYTVKLGLGKPGYEKRPDKSFALDANGQKIVKYPARMEVKRYFFPDEGNVPEPAIDAVQPVKAAPPPANDNRPAPRPAAAPAEKPAGSKPWAKKAA